MGRAFKVGSQNIGMPKKKDPDSVDADVFDFGRVDGVTPLDFSDEAHSAYSICGDNSQAPDIPQMLDFPEDFKYLDYKGERK
ncbi:hypothetical protein D4R89_05370 [bacterium]|nr:MAG: hypothetical protein D4R89_05370 [bacterium]